MLTWRGFVRRGRAGVNKIYLGFERFNLRVNYLACTNRRILTPDQSLTVRRRGCCCCYGGGACVR